MANFKMVYAILSAKLPTISRYLIKCWNLKINKFLFSLCSQTVKFPELC